MNVTIISASISLITAVFVAWITAQFTWKGEAKKRIYEKREEAYYQLFDLIQLLDDNPCYIFNYDEILGPFRSLRTKLNMYASSELLQCIEPFYKKVNQTYKEYADQFLTEEYLRQRACIEEYEGDTYSIQREEDDYMENHKMPEIVINNVQQQAIDIMRKDLANK